jgi:hypothetical protein
MILWIHGSLRIERVGVRVKPATHLLQQVPHGILCARHIGWLDGHEINRRIETIDKSAAPDVVVDLHISAITEDAAEHDTIGVVRATGGPVPGGDGDAAAIDWCACGNRQCHKGIQRLAQLKRSQRGLPTPSDQT